MARRSLPFVALLAGASLVAGCSSSPPPARRGAPAWVVTAPPSVASVEPGPPAPVPWPCPQQADVDGDGAADRLERTDRAVALVTATGRVPLGLPAPAVDRVCLADLDGDDRIELLAVLVRSTAKDPTFRRRLFVYEVDGERLRPDFLGTRGGGELLHAGVVDLDADGTAEVVARERTAEGEATRVFRFTGYQLTERPELAVRAPAYRYGPRFWPTAELGAATPRRTLAPLGTLSVQRAAAQARQAKLGPGLAGAVNVGRFHWLDVAARRRLGQDGFVVVRPGRGPDEFHSLYIQNQYDGVPSFVTADAALHLTHLLLDDLLQRTELELLAPALGRLLDGMRGQGRLLMPRLSAELAAALDAVLFRLDVAAALLEGHTHGLGAARAAAVQAELERITSRGRGTGPLAGLDYGTWVVRGHYTRSPALGRYFQAALLLSSAEARSSLEAALLTALAVTDPELRRLTAVLEDFGRTFVGPAASRTPLELAPAAAVAFGRTPRWDALGSKSGWERSPARHPAMPRGSAATLLARRWPVDDNLLALDPDHDGLPDPLQVLAGLGSERARRHLAPAFAARPALARQLGQARQGLRAGTLGDSRSIGGRLLLSLRWVLLPYPDGYPAFQRTTAWADHNLVTAAAFWAEWRRDTVLYVQPPVVWMEGGDEEELPPGKAGFVEPVPELFAELADVLKNVRHLLESVGYGAAAGSRARGQPELATLAHARELLEFLAEAARGELAGTGLAREQRERLSDIGPWLEQVLAGPGTLRLPPVPVVADVAYRKDPAGELADEVLTVGTGPLDLVVVAMPLGRRTVLARGAVSSFYAFPSSGPLTDEAWRAQLASGQAPAQPGWARPLPLPSYRRVGPPPPAPGIPGRLDRFRD